MKGMIILAIDPGTLTGYAVNSAPQISGVWDFSPNRFDGGGMRFLKFRHMLMKMTATLKPDLIVYEEVRKHRGTDAAHIYGGMVAHLTSFCEENNTPYHSVPIGTWKKATVGKGNATKDAILQYARKVLKYKGSKQDEADAICILEWAVQEYGTIKEKDPRTEQEAIAEMLE